MATKKKTAPVETSAPSVVVETSAPSAKFAHACKAWGARGQTWLDDGQKLAVAAALFFETHGEVAFINTLYNSMPKGSKTAAMAEWLVLFCNVKANDRESAKTGVVFIKGDKGAMFSDPEMLGQIRKKRAEQKWYLMGKPDPAPADIFDVDKALQKALSAIFTAAVKAKGTSDDGKLAELREWAVAHGVQGLPSVTTSAPSDAQESLADILASLPQ